MATNVWLSVIAKEGGVIVYPRTIRCQQWNDLFGHATELASIVGSLHSTDKVTSDKPIFTTGEPDHRLTYVLVKFSYLALFLYLNLDMLVSVRHVPVRIGMGHVLFKSITSKCIIGKEQNGRS